MLLRVLMRLEERHTLITLDQLVREVARRGYRTLSAEDVPALVEAAERDLLILSDRRTFYDFRIDSFQDRYVYRVNRRHVEARAEADRDRRRTESRRP